VPSSFGNDGKVVQRVGEIRVERTQLFFLNPCRTSQQFICRREVAIHRGAFRPIEDVTSTGWRHGVPIVERISQSLTRLTRVVRTSGSE
jgi:hypothetical protein